MFFAPAELERAMRVRDVIVSAMSGKYSWLQAAEILGMSPRSVRRWRWRMERHGYAGLIDMRKGRPSPRRASVEEIKRIVALYRDLYVGFNCRHFHEKATKEHGVSLSYTLVKQVLQSAGLLKKGRARGRHRRRREPRAAFGELLHIDGSKHRWLTLVPGEQQSLIAVVDDATKRLLFAQLFEAETTDAVMTALMSVIREFGIPQALYTDRARWAFLTRTAGSAPDRERLTQVGRALRALGIEHIPGFSPQARGRSERINRTLQDRLVNELRVARVRTVDAANRYLRDRFIESYNVRFSRPARERSWAFVPPTRWMDLEQILCHEEARKVGRDNVVILDGVTLQIGPQPGRRTCAGAHVQTRRHLDGRHTVWLGTRCLGRYDADGRPMDAASSVGAANKRDAHKDPGRPNGGRPQRPQAAANP